MRPTSLPAAYDRIDRNSNALGSGTANSQLAPITLNATGGNLSASILEIGTTIGTDPGGNNADFSYQVVAAGERRGNRTPERVRPGQINLGFLGNNNDGTGFAAYNANSLSTPRIVRSIRRTRPPWPPSS